jgi:hypothetical protein
MNWMALLIMMNLKMQMTLLSNLSKDKLPKGEFIAPMNLPLNLSGNFGEPRRGHFHTGIDIKTNEKEGYAVSTIADGYVSRIGVSPYGYGNALYITHPNGYTSVYGHLQTFSSIILATVRQEQYRQLSFAVDINLPKDSIKVKQGEQIALSGNTGGSGGPHLHFEIRDSKERPMNPLLFGYMLNDKVAPVINHLQLYNLDDDYFQPLKRLALKKDTSGYKTADTILHVNASKVGIAINTFDKMANSSNIFGVYEISVKDNGKIVFQYKNDILSFNEKRMIIAHLDYPVFLNESFKAFHKCFLELGNKMSSYQNVIEKGMINLNDSQPHFIEIEVADFNANISKANFILIKNTDATFFSQSYRYTHKLKCDEMNSFTSAYVKWSIPGKALVRNTLLYYTETESENHTFLSKVVTFNKNTEQLLDNFSLSIKSQISDSLASKLLIVWKDDKGKLISKSGVFANGFVTTSVREFGQFYVAMDTIKPLIRPLEFNSQTAIGAQEKWKFVISDNLSGIEAFDVFIDNVWTLAEFDGKSGVLAVLNQGALKKGEHFLRIIVIDERENSSTYESKFIY